MTKRGSVKVYVAFLAVLLAGFMAGASCVVWYYWPSQLLSVPFPDGGKVEIYYVLDGRPLQALTGVGGLLCQIYTEEPETITCRDLTGPSYDLLDDVELSYDVVDKKTVKIEEAGKKLAWTVHSDGRVEEHEQPGISIQIDPVKKQNNNS